MRIWLGFGGVIVVILAVAMHFHRPAPKPRDPVMGLLLSQPGRSSAQEPGSLFDSDFWKSGQGAILPDHVTARDGGEPDLLETTSPGNPLNPETGRPFSDEVTNQFERLRTWFPGNSLIPRRMTRDELAEENERQKRRQQLADSVQSGKASKEQVHEYYNARIKTAQDTLQLLEFVLKLPPDAMEPQARTMLTELRQSTEREMADFVGALQSPIMPATEASSALSRSR